MDGLMPQGVTGGNMGHSESVPSPMTYFSGALGGSMMGQMQSPTSAVVSHVQPYETEQPTLVNPKQYRRIVKRREARAKLRQLAEANHAMKRPRGEGGRFLTKDELVEYYKKNPAEKPEGWGEKRGGKKRRGSGGGS
ncbi:hypothetical protein TrRE_jg9401 [Triparma retinervis]|uniref:Nuclear transcription factor Y subunit n=1 Tax=Triparma retinervis TaxID=2557542 RepID=A0A9W7ASR6_9STRA|nr:hypothetical protein TrRE_jg9401 [Triparma retinervis]